MTTINYPPEASDCLFAQAEACRVYGHSSASQGNSIADQVNSLIERDILAADLRVSLFVAAAQSFKYESLLKPIHEKFRAGDGEVDIDRILSLARKFPSLEPAADVAGGDSDVEGQVSELLLSVLAANNHQQMNTVPYRELVRRVGGQVKFSPVVPDHCFEVVGSWAQNASWKKTLASFSSFHAFHGSRFENFHSILNLGLHQHLNTVPAPLSMSQHFQHVFKYLFLRTDSSR